MQNNLGQVSVLFVDDEQAILAAIKRVTRKLPARFFFLSNPIEALELIVKENIDIVVSDMRMPQMDGIEFLSNVAENYPETIRIMLTGNADSDLVMNAVNKGRIWSFLEKPWESEHLVMTISQAIQTRNLMRTRVNHLYQELEQAKLLADSGSKEKSNFLAVMSHEIRTPMNAMLGSMELLSSTQLDNEQKALLNNALTAGKSLSSLVNDVLDFSKIEAGKLSLQVSEFSTLDLVSYLHALFIERVKEKQIGLMFTISPRLSTQLLLDEQRIKQVLINLIANAIKFTHSGGVEVSVYANESQIHFEVKDTGIGIKNEDIPKLFSKFVQADSSYKRQFEGTGLGLAITKQLTELMGGEVRVGSKEGRGSSFLVAIPHSYFSEPLVSGALLEDARVSTKRVELYNVSAFCEEALSKQLHMWNCDVNCVRDNSELTEIRLFDGESQAPGTRIPYESGFHQHCYISHQELINMVLGEQPTRNQSNQADVFEQSGEGQRILVAEDSLPNQLVIKTMLERAGYQIDIADNGLAAVELAERNAYQLILMDLSMPIMDGAQATRIIRDKVSEVASIPIWAMTANVTKDDRQHCFDAGMNEFVEKPINKPALLAKLHKFFEEDLSDSLPARTDAEAGAEAQKGDPQKTDQNLLDEKVVEQLLEDTGEEIFQRVLELFISETERRICQVQKATLIDDVEQIEKEAHAIKSSAASVGAVRLGERAKALEAACRQRESHRVSELVAEVGALSAASLDALKSHNLFKLSS